MHDVSARIRLRPTRIALLVQPTSLPAIRKFMRICACLWGGAYNPIVPVFRSRPKEWRPETPDSLTGAEIARGYVDFFEPDVFVEAVTSLLERAGLSALRNAPRVGNAVIPLETFLSSDRHRHWSEPEVGLNAIDVMRDIYERERRFQLREVRPACIVKPSRNTSLVAALFGLYPDDEHSSYFARAYQDVFKPEVVEATPDTWIKVYKDGALTPLSITAYKLERFRSLRDDDKFFVFDSTKGTDLIDLWNLRLEPNPVLPIPIEWWPDLANVVNEKVAEQHRPLRGNPHGVMHRTTIEFARSISQQHQERSLALLDPTLPEGSWIWKSWRTAVWERHPNDHLPRARPLYVFAQEKSLTLSVRDSKPPAVEFLTLAPEFASLYGGGRHARWVNIVNLTSLHGNDVATVLPFNVATSAGPRMDLFAERVVVGTEGWSFPQKYKDVSQLICLHAQEDAIVDSLKHLGVQAHLSDSGRIAKEVLQHVGGLWGLHLVADPETLKLLNEMAGGTRTRKRGEAEAEEVFERRTRSERHWKVHVAKRRNRRMHSTLEISDFTNHNVLRLGLTTRCPRCTAVNWHSLTVVDYVVMCERCLEQYPFPQGALHRRNDNWGYRTIGPFSTHDYARGSYGALLALRALGGVSPDSEHLTFSSALELQVDELEPCEVDYVAWYARRSGGQTVHPELVFGEAKSFGDGDLIRSRDIAQLRRVANRFPGACIVISVMRQEFTANERRILLPFVTWTRRLNRYSTPANLVVLLTGVELFHDIGLESTWRDNGGRYERFADYDWTRSLHNLAQATQAIHLDLPLFAEDRAAAGERQCVRRNG